LLERLHDVEKERDKTNSRQLHMDQYCTLIPLFVISDLKLSHFCGLAGLVVVRFVAEWLRLAVA